MPSESSSPDIDALVDSEQLPRNENERDGSLEVSRSRIRSSGSSVGSTVDPDRFTFDVIEEDDPSETNLVEKFSQSESDDTVFSESSAEFWVRSKMLDNLPNDADAQGPFNAICEGLEMKCEEGRVFPVSRSPFHSGKDENLGYVTPGLTFSDESKPACVCNFVEPDMFPDIIKNPSTGKLTDEMITPVKNTMIDMLGVGVGLGILTNRKSFIFIKLLEDNNHYQQYFQGLPNGETELITGNTLSVPIRCNVLPNGSSRLTIDQAVHNFLSRSKEEGALQPKSFMYRSMAKAMEP